MTSNTDFAIIGGLTISGFAVLVLYAAYIFIDVVRETQCKKNMFSSFRSVIFTIINFIPILIFFAGAILFLITMNSTKNLKVSLPGIYWFNNILSGIGLIVSAFYVYGYSKFICNNYKPDLKNSLIRIIVPVILVITLMPFELNFIYNYQTDG